MGEWFDSHFNADFGSDFGAGVERRNPLPKGTYWQNVFDKDAAAFQDWLGRNSTTVKVRSTETHPPVTNWFSPNDPGWTFYKFEVLSPTSWEGPGLPTIVSQDETVTGAADTSTASDVIADMQSKSLSGKLEQAAMDPGTLAKDILKGASESAIPWKWIIAGSGVLAVGIIAYRSPQIAGSILTHRGGSTGVKSPSLKERFSSIGSQTRNRFAAIGAQAKARARAALA